MLPVDRIRGENWCHGVTFFVAPQEELMPIRPSLYSHAIFAGTSHSGQASENHIVVPFLVLQSALIQAKIAGIRISDLCKAMVGYLWTIPRRPVCVGVHLVNTDEAHGRYPCCV